MPNALLTLRVIVAPDGSRHLWSHTSQWGGDPGYVVSACNGAWMRREVKLGRPVKQPRLTCDHCDRLRSHPPIDTEPVPQTEACRRYGDSLIERGLYFS